MKFASSVFRCFHSSTKIPTDHKEEDGIAGWNRSFRVFSYDRLRAATQGFKNKIGEGGFGSVYKGRLMGDDQIAVKVLSVQVDSLRGEREFVSEIAALSNVKHENLVTLRGCCVDGTKRLLVYDYMENNNLSITFLGEEKKRSRFSWMLRKKIVLGIARGLCYLHEEVRPHIIHRDIKASNILLDENFNPKVGDFGLAKLFKDDLSYISTRVAGTLGYLSPEYAISGHLTRKSDVYSFGVLLLEIVSGRRPVADMDLQYGEHILVEKAWNLYNSNRLVELVDSALNGQFSQEEAICFLKVGLLCVQEITRLRPQMSAVVKMLENVIDTEDLQISRPGLLGDLMDVRVRNKISSSSTTFPATSSASSLQAR